MNPRDRFDMFICESHARVLRQVADLLDAGRTQITVGQKPGQQFVVASPKHITAAAVEQPLPPEAA